MNVDKLLESAQSGQTIRIPEGTHRISKPLNLRAHEGLRIVGNNARLEIVMSDAQKLRTGLDFTDCKHLTVVDLEVVVLGGFVDAAVLTGRSEYSRDAYFQRFENVRISPARSRYAAFMNVGSEHLTLDGCYFSNNREPDGAHGVTFYCGRRPPKGYLPAFGQVADGASMSMVDVHNCGFAHYGGPGSVSVWLASGTHSVRMFGNISCKEGFAGILIGGNAHRGYTSCESITLDCQIERKPKQGIYSVVSVPGLHYWTSRVESDIPYLGVETGHVPETLAEIIGT